MTAVLNSVRTLVRGSGERRTPDDSGMEMGSAGAVKGFR